MVLAERGVNGRKAVEVPSSMAKWTKLHLRMRGISGLLMHNPHRMGAAPAGSRGKVIPTPSEEAEESLYALPESHHLYVKADHVREMLAVGSTGYRWNRRAARPMIVGAVLESPDHPFFVLTRDGEPLTTYDRIDTRRAVVQRQGIMRSRGLILPPYEFEAIFDFDAGTITAEFVMTIMQDAGKRAGILDYRPQKGGPFGRVEVFDAWEED